MHRSRRASNACRQNTNRPRLNHRRSRSGQFGLTSAPMVPHFVHTMRGSNDFTVRSPAHHQRPARCLTIAGLSGFLTLIQSARGAVLSFRGLAPIAAAVIPVRLRINSEHAIDAANDATCRAANNPADKATDRSEHAVTGTRCAELAEADAGRAADLLAPAVAVAFMAKAQLAQITAADVGEALRTRDAFREAADAAQAVFATLKAAEMRLMSAITAVARDGVAKSS
jgi:hypothetical protein